MNLIDATPTRETCRTGSAAVGICAAAASIAVLSVWYMVLGIGLAGTERPLPYFVTEYLVTFADGFVRRGALGQSLFDLASIFACDPLQLVLWIRIAIGLSYLGVLGALLMRNRSALGTLGIWVLLTNPLVSFYAWRDMGAVDVLFLLTSVFHLWLSKRGGTRYWIHAAALFWTVGVFLMLSHEGFILLGLPVNLVISCRALGGFTRTSIKKLLLIYLAPIAAFAVAVRYHGTPIQAATITQFWLNRGVPLPRLSAIEWLGASPEYEFWFLVKEMTPLHLLMWGLGTMSCVLPLALLWLQLLKSAPPEDRRRMIRAGTDFAVVPTLSVLPLYAIGMDWHRWLALPLATATVCLLASTPSRTRFEQDSRMRGYLVGLVIVGLLQSPAAIYHSMSTSASGPLMGTKELLLGSGANDSSTEPVRTIDR